MVTKYKAAVFIIAAMFSSIASAAYTTMTIEGVKQANGVWTAAGVMDTQGFVRTTGAVSVLNTTRNLPVAASVDVAASGLIAKSAARLAGPAALALAAYDVYQLFTDSGLQAGPGGEWIADPQAMPPETMKGVCYKGGGAGIAFNNVTFQYCMDFMASDVCIKSPGSWVNCSAEATYSPTAQNQNWSIKRTYCRKSDPSSCSSSSTAAFYFPVSSGQPVWTGRPANDSDFSKIPNLTIPQIISLWASLPSLLGKPYPITGTNFTPYSEWLGDPYFKDGNWWRDRMDISPSGTKSSPTRVRADIGPVKFGDATNPNVVPDTGPAGGTGGAPQPEKEKPTFCEANPMSIACAEMGELKDEKLEVEERPVDVSYTPWGSSTSQCPADKVIPLWDDQSITISYSPVCQFASLLRPLVIALAFVAAGFIVAGITRKGAES
ncbi:virulence factor TspB C-terminal domain-related protein [Aeromonas veronii]|uniref:virulence factor TspB C-terminal domain-related protein n=1 Tax=Aeromonas veronii TaxID=654 RepID=UPI0021D8849E|nr:virulence factor TspB C-terminal domain-related protein [Aeromonas veronii]UYB72937.1 virulence factor TspB C-terminal domain-related protein [Aeromonas veronii]